MKLNFASACLIAGMLIAPVAAQAADAKPDSKATTYVKDSVITTKIKAKLAEEKMSSLANIQVDTDDKGAVVLSGKVATQAEEDKAVSIAKGTEGVSSVKSLIKTK